MNIKEAYNRFLNFKVCYKCKIKNKKNLKKCRKCNKIYFRDKKTKVRKK